MFDFIPAIHLSENMEEAKAMAKKAQNNTKEKIVLKSLELAVERGWASLTLQDIARESGVTLADVYDHFEDKTDILGAFGRMIDRRILESISEPDETLASRDILFDVLMDRLEALNEHREGVVAILQSFHLDPKQAVISLPHLCRSMSWMLEAAGINTNGLSGALKVAGLSAIYLKILRTWKDDESEDLAKTMAALDKDLNRAEQLANTFGF